MKISKARSIKIPFFPDPNPEEKLRRYSNNSGQIEFFSILSIKEIGNENLRKILDRYSDLIVITQDR
ncbi:MAG: hypothetical protein F6K22_23005 [Okeania sp. SIO2F4]|uniref:hypothetical protein n=1 Tax=Okeania sp. SIO2F4 TaxID=2607790 RepID=UPI00142BC9C0|nr:hypothetical protein [Okeania sp. SIO2F4]NES05429.1 hypothetical protein [Okeania sp. SIO2F4]